MGAKIIYATILILLCFDALPSSTSTTHRIHIGPPQHHWGPIWPPHWPQWPGHNDGNHGGNNNNNNNNNELREGFYDASCPQAENIIEDIVSRAATKDPTLPAALIRLYFHDCFVEGCDASVLLDSTPSGGKTEKIAVGNLGLRGFDVIDEIKMKLEEVCPQTVSCADIISYATRDTVTKAGLPRYRVAGGRRDGKVSEGKNLDDNLPLPDSDVKQMLQIFTKKGLNEQDLVVLLGAHSIGVAHCNLVEDQFYNYSSNSDYNPHLDISYAMQLRNICPTKNKTTDNDVVPLNIVDDTRLSNVYYVNMLRGRVVLPSDQSLLDDPNTRVLVETYAVDHFKWVREFEDSMVKLGKVGVLTGDKGEIRRSCRAVNL